MKKQKFKIEERKIKYEVERISYIVVCPYCKREVSGIDKKTALRNIKKHIIKCKEKNK